MRDQHSAPLLDVSGLRKHFALRAGLLSRTVGYVRAVDGVDLRIRRRESFGLVGESGSGKTTAVRCVLRLIEPTHGTVRFDGHDIGRLRGSDLQRFRRRAQMVFQDPYSSLNPRFTVRSLLAEPLVIHRVLRGARLHDRVLELLDLVGLKPDHLHRYPHEFSGGQRQRIAIARALALEPELLVLDEPTSALDVSVQAQILNLLNRLQQQLGLTYLMISHDLAVIRHMCDRIAVMYRGKVVEEGAGSSLFEHPLHPYTRLLLASIPALENGAADANPPQLEDPLWKEEINLEIPLVEVESGHSARIVLKQIAGRAS